MTTSAHFVETGSRALVFIGFFVLGVTILRHGQDNTASAQSRDDFKIQIGVEEVRLDAVVLDGKGRQVTDLTADDFEIFQDDQRQDITSCSYTNEYHPQPKTQAGSAKDSKTMPPMPAPRLEREDVRRMIAFVVDNLSMSFQHVHYARTALKKFVETQMQPGDVVAIVQTAGGNSARQLFSNDKRYLLRAIDKIVWYMDPRIIKQYATQDMAIDYFIRALWDMPGRKALILMTAQTMVPNFLVSHFNQKSQGWEPDSVEKRLIENTLNPLADRALRAGVVIHTMDVRGLDGLEAYDSEFGADKAFSADSENILNGKYAADRTKKISESSSSSDTEIWNPLSQKTGGLSVSRTNWFVNGIGPVNEALKGYYLLTYIPPTGTFGSGSPNKYHRTKIRVKRPGLKVLTRDGFFGMTHSMDASLESPTTMRDAIYYPFQHSDLDVNLASGYIDDPQKGYLLRYSMHLDGKNLIVVEGKDGINSIYVDLACITSSMDKFIQDAGNLKYEFCIKNENVPWIRKHGLRFSLDLPVEKPGAYYVRAAVRDVVSGKAGNAYQFIEIPDLKKSRLSLSNIFIINREEDAPWVPSQAQKESRNLLYPDMRRDPRKSPALRSYLPGESFEYAAVIYNAKSEKAKKPDLESQFVLYGNGDELYKGETEAVDLSGMSDFTRIPIRKKLYLDNSIQPGDYILLLQVKDKQAKEKYNQVHQILDFRVLSKADFSGEEKSEAVEQKEITLSPEILAQYVGTYKIGPGQNAAITLEESRLFTQVTGEIKLPLYPESESKFFIKGMADAENEFVKDDTGAVTHMIVRRGGNETKVPRISNEVVERKEITLSPEILAQYVGTYKMGPGLEMMITLWNGRQLYSQIPRQRMIQLCPETETKFFLKVVADVEYEFVKNGKGTVTHVIIRQEGSEQKAPRISKKVQKKPE
jgi:VWFA-related protein